MFSISFSVVSKDKMSNDLKMLFAGLEGGSSNSNCVLIRGDGEILATIGGGTSTNHLLIGEEECQRRIVDLLDEAKKAAGLSDEVKLDGLGLCMSGCEDNEANLKFAESMMNRYPKLSKSIIVKSDTIGSIMTVCPTGKFIEKFPSNLEKNKNKTDPFKVCTFTEKWISCFVLFFF